MLGAKKKNFNSNDSASDEVICDSEGNYKIWSGTTKMLKKVLVFRDRLQISLLILNEIINFYSLWNRSVLKTQTSH